MRHLQPCSAWSPPSRSHPSNTSSLRRNLNLFSSTFTLRVSLRLLSFVADITSSHDSDVLIISFPSPFSLAYFSLKGPRRPSTAPDSQVSIAAQSCFSRPRIAHYNRVAHEMRCNCPHGNVPPPSCSRRQLGVPTSMNPGLASSLDLDQGPTVSAFAASALHSSPTRRSPRCPSCESRLNGSRWACLHKAEAQNPYLACAYRCAGRCGCLGVTILSDTAGEALSNKSRSWVDKIYWI